MDKVTVINGQYGYYYPYTNEKGRKCGLKILDDVYENYYSKGYLTDDHLAMLVEGKTITFEVPSKNGGRPTLVTAKILPYTNKAGRDCKIIDFSSSKPDDKQIIKAKAEQIVTSYWNETRFDYTKPQAVIDSLDLDQTWKTYAINYYLNHIRICSIKLYRPRARKDDSFYLYGKVENNKCEMISEEQYKSIQAQAKAEADAKYAEQQAKQEACNEVKNKMYTWLNSIIEQIWNGGDIAKNAELLVESVSVPNLKDRVAGMIGSTHITPLSKCFDSAKDAIASNIYTSNYSEPKTTERIKTRLFESIKVWVETNKIRNVRRSLFKEYQESGLDSLTDSIDIDTALSLGYFPQVQKILVKYKANAPKYIIYNMYQDIIDPVELKDKLLNLLKVYYDFYDMPEKDRKAIAKYIAKHKLSDYYDRISRVEEVLDVLLDNSRDPKLVKPLLEGIAGTPKANILKNKTYYFEKRGRLRNVLLYKPIELVESLRDCIKEFNSSSGVAILTNIELDADESFIFQFYTFAEAEGDEQGFDGRRMLNLTRIYNRSHPNAKIGFYFNNESEDSSEDDE